MTDFSYINNGEERERAEYDEVIINGVSIPVASVQFTDTSRFESKLTFGDYSKDSDQVLSTWVQNSWVGGMLLNQHQEGATDQRGRWARAWTLSSEQLSLPPRMSGWLQAQAIPSSETRTGPYGTPLIEIGDTVYFSYGNQVRIYASKSGDLSEVTGEGKYIIPGFAQSQAVIERDRHHFMVPLGDDGCVVLRAHTHPTNPYTIADTHTGIRAVSLELWDKKIFAATTDRYLHIFDITSGTWRPVSEDLRVPYEEEMRHVLTFWDMSGNQGIFVVTDRGLWAYDPEVGKLYKSSLPMPKNISNGLGVAVFRDDAMYISSGLGVTRYTRDGVRTPMGLDRDDSIPEEHSGNDWTGQPQSIGKSITSLVETQNFLAAAVQLGELDDPDDPTVKIYPYAICAWNEGGWHVLYEGDYRTTVDDESGAYPHGLMVSEHVGGYRLWWGMGAVKRGPGAHPSAWVGHVLGRSIPIPSRFLAPRMRVDTIIPAFANYGYYETGWFDAGMRGFEKTWSHLEVYLDPLPTDSAATGGSIEVSYRTSLDPLTWISLGSAATVGRSVFKFKEDATGFPVGETSVAIELRFELFGVTPGQSPIINSFILKFIKLPLPGRAWMLSIPLDGEDIRGIGPQEIDDILSRQTWQGGFSWMLHKNKKYRVRVSQHQGVEGAANVPYKQGSINIIEVPIPGDPIWGGGL